MRKLITKLGKEFTSDVWRVYLSNATNTYSMCFKQGFELTYPFPGNILEQDNIKLLIEFLQQTLEEKEDEQSNVE
jgi:hypothetical protein